MHGTRHTNISNVCLPSLNSGTSMFRHFQLNYPYMLCAVPVGSISLPNHVHCILYLIASNLNSLPNHVQLRVIFSSMYISSSCFSSCSRTSQNCCSLYKYSVTRLSSYALSCTD
uniref:Uncharacterized protein n=1 Tax=Arundo donax TaxID=35708 RepID=A0A0A8Z3C2_ARUDO